MPTRSADALPETGCGDGQDRNGLLPLATAVTGEAGDAARARDLLAELLPIKERVLGAEHPDALEARHDLATCR
jgi:hypothetical protein